MIPNAYRATILISGEHRGGKKLLPADVRDFVTMSFSSSSGDAWDHPPEYEIAELAAPGTWCAVPGAPLFTFDEARARLLWGDNAEGVELELDPIDRKNSPDALDAAITAALDHAAITSTRPGAAWVGVYPQSSRRGSSPMLCVTPGDGGPLLLDPHEWSWPSDEKLEGVELTIAVLRWAVERANQLIADNEARGAEQPILDHVYNGAALRLTCWDEDDEPISHAGTWESISGTFRVVAWVGEDGAIVGNGESPEQFWRTADKPERIA